jgi:hypothetical protein
MTARVLALVVLAAASLQAQVTFDRILHPEKEPQNWLSYSGSLFNQRFSPLTQITTANAKNLELQWIWQAKSLEKYEATSIVVDGVLYTVEAPNNVIALDAVTGRPFWTFTYENLPDARNCCGRVNRGVAVLGDKVFMGTLDAHLLALDAKTGRLLWKTQVAKTARPLRRHARADDRQGQGDHRNRGRRLRRASRHHRSVRCHLRQGAVALLHDSGARRAGQRDVVRRFVEGGRCRRVEQRRLRPRDEPGVLRHR